VVTAHHHFYGQMLFGDNRLNDRDKAIVEEFRANKGKVGGRFAGTNLLLLHTNGAKTGLERVNPMMYHRDGDRYIVVAIGRRDADTNPDWYHNLLATPELSVEVGTEQFPVIAMVSSEPERTKLYEKMESISSGFTDYKNKSSRVIPVVTLTRKS
jgi:deazaflavin-dependent oxidoreductase (nitroreductase family)